MNTVIKNQYFGITHHLGVRCSKKRLEEWRKKKCKKWQHVFDEVLSGDGHYLSCDACGLVVNIKSIDTKYVGRTP